MEKSKKITQKIRELLTSEDLAIFEGAVEGMIEGRVQSQLTDLINLKEEELKTKYDTLAEKYVRKVVAKKVLKEKATLVKDYDAKLGLLEQKIVTKLDSYLDHVIKEQISDEMLEKLAINETLMPVVEGIRSVFTDNHLKVDSKAKVLVDNISEEVTTLKSDLSESIDTRIQLEEQLEKSAVYLLISEKTNGLKRTDKQKVVDMFKTKPFEEVDDNIDNYVTLVKESSNPVKKKKAVKKTVKDKVASVNEGAVVDVDKATKAPVKEAEVITEQVTINDVANRYL